MDKIYIVMDFIKHDLKALMSTMKEKFLEGTMYSWCHYVRQTCKPKAALILSRVYTLDN